MCAHTSVQVHFETATFGLATFVFCCLKALQLVTHKSRRVSCIAPCTFTCIALFDCRQQFAAQMPTACQMKLVYPPRCDAIAAGKLPVATLPPTCLGSNKPRVRKTFIACSKPKPQVHAKQPAAQSCVSCVKGTRCGCKQGASHAHATCTMQVLQEVSHNHAGLTVEVMKQSI